ncbi:MAG: DUF4440 domain-containing protein [Sphingomicrobium sp.]
MRTAALIATATSAAFLLAGCHRGDRSDFEQTGITDTAAVEQHLRDIETQWMGDYNARNVDALAAHYADDAALANPGAALATDPRSRREDLAKSVADPSLQLKFEADRAMVAKSGDLAYTRGHFTSQTNDPSSNLPKVDSGTYLTVWRKQTDGSWKAIEDAVVPGPSDDMTPG